MNWNSELCLYNTERWISTDCCPFCLSFVVASAYQLSLLTAVALIFEAFDVIGNTWTFSLYPLLIREDLK